MFGDLLFPSAGGSPGPLLPFIGGAIEQKIDLLLPLRLQMEQEKRLRPLWMVLGTIEAGGAAYIAYEHLRKYGLK